MADSSVYAGELRYAKSCWWWLVDGSSGFESLFLEIELLGSGMLYQKHGEKSDEMTSRKLELQLRIQFPGQIQNLPTNRWI